jgi:hypothetical protein
MWIPACWTSNGLTLIGDDEPRAAVAAVYAETGRDARLAAGGAIKRVNVFSVAVIPIVVLYEDFYSDLSLSHCSIIKEWPD